MHFSATASFNSEDNHAYGWQLVWKKRRKDVVALILEKLKKQLQKIKKEKYCPAGGQ